MNAIQRTRPSAEPDSGVNSPGGGGSGGGGGGTVGLGGGCGSGRGGSALLGAGGAGCGSVGDTDRERGTSLAGGAGGSPPPAARGARGACHDGGEAAARTVSPARREAAGRRGAADPDLPRRAPPPCPALATHLAPAAPPATLRPALAPAQVSRARIHGRRRRSGSRRRAGPSTVPRCPNAPGAAAPGRGPLAAGPCIVEVPARAASPPVLGTGHCYRGPLE